VPTIEKECESDIDEMAKHEVPKIVKDKLPNVENANEEIHAISEEEGKFEKQSSRKIRPQEKGDPKRRKYEKN